MVKLKYQFKSETYKSCEAYYRVQNDKGSYIPLTVKARHDYDFFSKKFKPVTYTFYQGDLTDKSDDFYSSPIMEELVKQFYPKQTWLNSLMDNREEYTNLKDLKKALNFLAEKYAEKVA